MKMDSSIINKEGIEKLLTMLPSEEDISRIEEAQESSPDLPLGTAEQFLLTLRKVQSSGQCLCLLKKKKPTSFHIRLDLRLSVQ